MPSDGRSWVEPMPSVGVGVMVLVGVLVGRGVTEPIPVGALVSPGAQAAIRTVAKTSVSSFNLNGAGFLQRFTLPPFELWLVHQSSVAQNRLSIRYSNPPRTLENLKYPRLTAFFITANREIVHAQILNMAVASPKNSKPAASVTDSFIGIYVWSHFSNLFLTTLSTLDAFLSR